MKPTPAVAALCLLAIPAFTVAQDLGLKHRTPEPSGEYTVRRGDTLWDISASYLGDPFTWPDLWKRNEFIRNPHRIYPGQVLHLGLKPAASPAVPPVEPPVAAPPETPRPELLPADPVPTAVPAVSPVRTPEAAPPDRENVLRMLREPRPVFTEKSFMRAGFITKRSELPRNRILRIEGETESAIRYDTVVVSHDSRPGFEEGSLLAVIAPGDRVKHPVTGYDYGVVVRIKGILKVLSAGESQVRCTVTETFDPLASDDLVMPWSPGGGPLFDAWVKPDAEIRGVILAVNEPMLSIHTNDILFIDKGERDGVRPGDVFTVYRSPGKGEDDGGRSTLGVLEAISVMPGETAVVVSSLTGETISVGARVELSARCRLVEK